MNDIPIVGVLLGPSVAAARYGVKKDLVLEMIVELDFENHPFFQRLKTLLKETTEELGEEETARAFSLNSSVIQ